MAEPRQESEQERGQACVLPRAEVYVGYLTERPDSVLGAMRVIAPTPDGATIVHCAAGKDRTGIIIALALEEVGVEREAIIEDYALTAERIEAVMRRLLASATYIGDLKEVTLDPAKVDRHTPRAEAMRDALAESTISTAAYRRTYVSAVWQTPIRLRFARDFSRPDPSRLGGGQWMGLDELPHQLVRADRLGCLAGQRYWHDTDLSPGQVCPPPAIS